MAAIQKHHSTNKMKITMTCRADQLTRQPSNISNYEGYHGGEAASVPFTWESEPGTPKVKFRDTTLPPLTPPPSYSYSSNSNNKRSTIKAHKKNSSSSSSSSKSSSLFYTIFPKRVTARKARVPPSPTLSSSSSSSSSSRNLSSPGRLRSRSVPASPMRCSRKLDRDDDHEEEEDLYDTPVSRLCFGNARSRGCYSSVIKKVLLGDIL